MSLNTVAVLATSVLAAVGAIAALSTDPFLARWEYISK